MKIAPLATMAAMAAIAALTAAAGPAAAHPYDRRGDRYEAGAFNINARQARLDARIDAGVRHGDLSRREAWRLRAEFRDVARLEARYRVNGLSPWERNDLERRLDRLDAQVRFERHDHQDRRW